MEENLPIVAEQNQIEHIHEIALQSTPVKLMEGSLAKFLNDTFTMVKEEDDYQKQIKDAIIAKLPDMKASELIALATSAATNKNDLISKLVSPTMQLLTAAQQNELATKQREQNPQFTQNNIREINTNASSDVIMGLKTLFDLAQKLEQKEIVSAVP